MIAYFLAAVYICVCVYVYVCVLVCKEKYNSL